MHIIAPSELDSLVIGSRYEIEGPPRHTGGFAHLYKAFDRNVNNRPVAVKVLRDLYAGDKVWRQHFLEEASSLHTVSGPNVVIVHDLIDQDPETGLDFIVMEWIDGQNLEQFRLASTSFDISYLLRLAIGIADGVNGIHSKGLVHGDITPKNIMFRGTVPVIIDFGLAWDLQYGIEVEKEHCGTISYLAPERFKSDKEHGTEADIYALGAVLFFLFTGNHYFPELKAAEQQFLASLSKRLVSTVSLRKHNQIFLSTFGNYRWQPIRSSELPGKLLARLNGLVHRTLSPQPDRRPDAYEVSGELKQILEALTQKSQNLIFPLQARDYRVVIANYEDGLLFDDRLELKARDHQGKWMFETNDLYLLPGEEICDGVLFHEDRIVYSGRFEIKQQPFRFSAHPSPTGEITALGTSQGSLKTLIPTTLSECEFQLEVNTRNPLQIALLIDGTMSDNEINIARDFMAELFSGIATRSYETQVAICIYGEYKYHPGNKKDWHIPFDIQFQDFHTLEKGWEFIQTHLIPYEFRGKGYAGSLEFGLLQLQRVHWQSSIAKHLLIIGTSPPHPNGKERARFRLVDFTVEEYRYKDQNTENQIPHWLHVLGELRELGIYPKGIWLPPSDFDLIGDVIEFIDFVWEEINGKRSPMALPPIDTRIDASSILSTIDGTIRSIPVIEKRINFPLLSPLDVGKVPNYE